MKDKIRSEEEEQRRIKAVEKWAPMGIDEMGDRSHNSDMDRYMEVLKVSVGFSTKIAL